MKSTLYDLFCEGWFGREHQSLSLGRRQQGTSDAEFEVRGNKVSDVPIFSHHTVTPKPPPPNTVFVIPGPAEEF